MKTKWWQKALKVIQYNLQIRDTDKMVPEEIAKKAADAAADAVVLNVGGIYAWYESQIPFHHINEYLPGDRNLLEELIRHCHEEGVRVIGRFDFSKTDDVVFLQHPEWFVKDREGKPVCYGSGRMGSWSLLLSTCMNGGYRNGEFAAEVLREALARFEIDGIFFNAPQMEVCYCENCKRKYKKLYGEELPKEAEAWRPDWQTRCLKENMELMYRIAKEDGKDAPVILYYGTYREDGGGQPENLDMRYATADLICTEAQDILSAGKKKLPYTWKPTLNMKLGQGIPDAPRPFGIIHSCPGMDWRHTGLPAAEYEFWMSQIPAANGQIWHSLTGFDAVITDKRLLRTMEKVNRKIKCSDEWMQGAESAAEVLLLWNAGVSELGFVDGLMSCHIPFDIMDIWHCNPERMKRYQVIILPGQFPAEDRFVRALREYVAEGGSLLAEKTDTGGLERLAELFGIRPEAETGRGLSAAYGILEPAGQVLSGGLSDTFYLPIKGDVLYVRMAEHTGKLMTLVPPFAPYDGVGAPPERASIPVKKTDIPLLSENRIGKGKVLASYFGLSGLLLQIGLADQKRLFENCLTYLAGEERVLEAASLPEGIFIYPYYVGEKVLIHLVNGIGARPLRDNIVCHDLNFSFRKRERGSAVRVFSALEGAKIRWETEGETVRIRVERLAVWDIIVIEPDEENSGKENRSDRERQRDK